MNSNKNVKSNSEQNQRPKYALRIQTAEKDRLSTEGLVVRGDQEIKRSIEEGLRKAI